MTTFVEQQAFGFLVGHSQPTQQLILVASRDNSAASVTLNGVTLPVSWVATNTDIGNGIAGYTGTVTFTGLSPFTPYGFTVTQNGVTYTGSCHTAPDNEGQSFRLFLATCDRVNGGTRTAWLRIKHYLERSLRGDDIPCLGMVFGDDFGYTDTRQVVGVSTGIPATSSDRFYDRAVAYLSLFGLYDEDSAGREWERLWCLRNMNLAPQWGDHEFINDIGWISDVSVDHDPAAPNYGTQLYHLTPLGFDGSGLVMYNKFLGPLQPSAIAGATDTDANHWDYALGPLNIVALDSVTNGDAQVSKWYGPNQVADVLSSFSNAAKPFNIMFCQHQARQVLGSGASKNLSQIAGLAAEYAALHTDAGSLSDISYTNGQNGCLVVVSGDYHANMVTTNENAGGVNPEWYMQLVIGGVEQGGVSHTLSVGDTDNGTTVKRIGASNEFAAHCVMAEYRANEIPSSLHMIGEFYDGTPEWHSVHAPVFGNDYVAEDYAYSSPSIVSSGE